MCSPRQHNKALSRTTWFEYTSERKEERCTAPYASTHHIIFPQPWMRPSHRQPPLSSDSQSQNLSQHVFYTMQRKTLFGVCTEQNPQGGLSSGCKSKESLRESFGEKEKRVAFLRICKAVSYYLQSFMWCEGLFIANFAKLSPAKPLLLLFECWLKHRICFHPISDGHESCHYIQHNDQQSVKQPYENMTAILLA